MRKGLSDSTPAIAHLRGLQHIRLCTALDCAVESATRRPSRRGRASGKHGGSMNHHVRSLFRRHSAVAVLLLGTASLARAQEPGTIAGRVMDAASNAPIPAAQVVLVGTTRGVVAGDDGRFRIAGVRPGQYTVRALRLGYQASAQTV